MFVEIIREIAVTAGVFVGLGALMGAMLAAASRAFAVKTDPRIDEVRSHLPGANCGGCGFAGCSAFAEALAGGKAKPSGCAAADSAAVDEISRILGVEAGHSVRMRAQVMCSGTSEAAKKKYIYSGVSDCISAVTLGGGDKLCPNGCIGLGTCVRSCKFGAISVRDGVAVVDYNLCRACGMCVASCPKGIIELVPFESRYHVGCKSVDNGKITRSYCDVGCISCRLCERGCEYGAITVDDCVAHIDYSKCTHCGKCSDKCPRGIIKPPDFLSGRA